MGATTGSCCRGSLTVGFYGSAAIILLPDVLYAFSREQPLAEVRVRELLMGSINEVLDGMVDIAFTRLLPNQTELPAEVMPKSPGWPRCPPRTPGA